jgi:hypothetical protein
MGRLLDSQRELLPLIADMAHRKLICPGREGLCRHAHVKGGDLIPEVRISACRLSRHAAWFPDFDFVRSWLGTRG